MVAMAVEFRSDPAQAPRRGPGWWFSGVSEMARRNIRHILRSPELVAYALIQPVMFVLLFTYVFGGAMHVPGGNYKQFLLPGIFVQMVLFGSVFGTTVGVSTDLRSGIMDRFRSMPISRSAVLVGRTVSEILRNLVSVAVMIVVGLLIGFRLDDGLLPALGGLALLLFFGYAMSWLGVYVGMSTGSPNAAQSAGLTWLFPFTFLSSAFAPTGSMPGWLQAYADHSPMTTMVDSVRGLSDGTPVGSEVLQTLAWSAGVTLLFGTLAVRKYASQSR
ncbi:ABC transporter DrrB family efflux protein [Catenulispora sp. GAS73]|uniref:ABC transporter permease n=1 Tax=Catenulispora sp. GAS73 TaxID=3156269 RepID=UPI00351268E8